MSRSYPILTVNLAALAANYRLLQHQVQSARVGAVVKANAYGLGAEAVAEYLYQLGCRDFFVASTEEGAMLRPLLPKAQLFVLQGVEPGDEGLCLEHQLTPMLISSSMAQRFLRQARMGRFGIKVNTGMNRLGMEPDECTSLLPQVPPQQCQLLLSHLACADEPNHPLNGRQLNSFRTLSVEAKQYLPGLEFSLANSAGIFLGAAYHWDLVRPGAALYGLNPGNLASGTLAPVASLLLQVIQTRTLKPGACVGYGASFTSKQAVPVAVVSGGYADGLMRSLSQKSCAWFRGVLLPLIGRVSMDSLVFDVSPLPPALRPVEGDRLELFGPNIPVDDQAETAGTLGYELFTRLGERCQRQYLRCSDA